MPMPFLHPPPSGLKIMQVAQLAQATRNVMYTGGQEAKHRSQVESAPDSHNARTSGV
jgi:hypothetical protein